MRVSQIKDKEKSVMNNNLKRFIYEKLFNLEVEIKNIEIVVLEKVVKKKKKINKEQPCFLRVLVEQVLVQVQNDSRSE